MKLIFLRALAVAVPTAAFALGMGTTQASACERPTDSAGPASAVTAHGMTAVGANLAGAPSTDSVLPNVTAAVAASLHENVDVAGLVGVHLATALTAEGALGTGS